MKIVLLESLGVSSEIIEGHRERLEAMGHTLVVYEKNTDPEVQAERCRDAEVLILANMPLAASAIEAAETLKFIDVAFTGVDHIPMAEAKKRGIPVSNASGYATQAVAELTVGFMIQLLRRVKQTEERCREGGTKEGLVGGLLCGKTVGILGPGAIGRRVAALVKAFGCRVVACGRSPIRDSGIDQQLGLEELLRESDILTLHCPLTPQTRGLIGEKELDQMKKTAFLINTARGPVVDQEALARALAEGRIAGAACDVFDQEPPLPREHILLRVPNLVATPHIAFATEESMEQRADIVFRNLYSWLEGTQLNAV